jgi:hypothetical protein
VTFFKVSTAIPKMVILVERKKILLTAQRRAEEDLLYITTYDFTLDDRIKEGKLLPRMNLCVQNAKLKGQEVLAFVKLSHHAQFTQRSWHLELTANKPPR